MDEELLFTNKFINQIDNQDTTETQKKEFRDYIEKTRKVALKKDVLNKTSKSFSASNTLPLNHFTNSDVESVVQAKTSVENIDSRFRNTTNYPLQNSFEYNLSKTYINVSQIKLKSTEFPNTDQVIKDYPIELQNNLIFWQNAEDNNLNFYTGITINTVVSNTIDLIVTNHGLSTGVILNIIIYNSQLNTDLTVTGIIDGDFQATVIDSNTLRIEYLNGISSQGTADVNLGYPVYSVTLKPGNYTATTLTEEIQSELRLVKRQNGTGQFHYFTVSVNLDTNVISFDSVTTTRLITDPIATISDSTIITVTQKAHGFYTGDRVLMINVSTTAGINSTELNGNFTITVLDYDTFIYEVITPANSSTNGGGNNVQTGKDAPFRLLFNTENTLIQYNTGFPNEDSSVYIGSADPITTKILTPLSITQISSSIIRITTSVNHELDATTIINISSIASGTNPIITTSTPHGLTLQTRVNMRNTNSTPVFNGTFYVLPVGRSTLKLINQTCIIPGVTGQILYGGDKIQITGLDTVPAMRDNTFFIENIPAVNQFDISFNTTQILSNSLSNVIIGTSQVFVKHNSHGFNTLNSITSLSSGFISCETKLPSVLIGNRTDNVTVIDGPSSTNQVDILLQEHGLSTSNQITISNSTTTPVIDGIYNIQVIDTNTIRINFVHTTLTSGTATIETGDKVTLTSTNSLPRVDGTYYINNRKLITNISTGTISVNITFSTQHNWNVGDIITLSNTDCTPTLNGQLTIIAVVNTYTVTVNTSISIISPGSSGVAINTTRFEIYTGFSLTSPGTYGIIGRDMNVILYRITADNVSGNDNIGGIFLNVLNGITRTITRLIDINTYMLRIDDNYAIRTSTSGGTGVVVSSLINGLRATQYNTDTGDSSGTLYRIINLAGESYVFLTSPGLMLDIVRSPGTNDILAKLPLTTAPGTMIYDSFVSAPMIYDIPLSKLSTILVEVRNSQGYYFNLNDIDFSFSLEITELINQNVNSLISTRTNIKTFGSQKDTSIQSSIQSSMTSNTTKNNNTLHNTSITHI